MLKKYISIALAVVAVLLLAACEGSPNIPTGDTVKTAPSSEMPQTTEPVEDTAIAPSLGVGERGDYEEDPVTTVPQGSETGATEPEKTVPNTTEPEETAPTTPPETTPEDEQGTLTFAQYEAMSVEEQEAFVESFPTLRDFVDWWNAAKAAEEKEDNTITGDPNIDLGDLVP